MSPSTRSFSNLKEARFKLRTKIKIIAKIAKVCKNDVASRSSEAQKRSHFLLCCDGLDHETYQFLHDKPPKKSFSVWDAYLLQ